MEENQVVEEIKKSEIDLVKESREKLKSENDLLEAELLRKERLRAEAIMGGKSQVLNTTPREETPKEYKDRIMRGG